MKTPKVGQYYKWDHSVNSLVVIIEIDNELRYKYLIDDMNDLVGNHYKISGINRWENVFIRVYENEIEDQIKEWVESID